MSRLTINVPSREDARRSPFGGYNVLFAASAACFLCAAVVAGVMAGKPFAGVAVAGPITFWVICWYRPQWALLLIFASCPFQTDLTAGFGPIRFSVAEVQLFLALPVFVARSALRKQRISLGPIMVPLLLYLIACVGSSLVIWRGTDAIVSFVQVVQNLVFGVILFAYFPDDLRQLRLPMYGLVISGLCLVAFAAHPVVNPLAMNKNGLGTGIAFATITCTELWFSERHRLRRWLLTAALLVLSAGLIVTLSRGAWLSTFAGVAVIVIFRGRSALLLQIAIVLLPVIYASWHFLPAESRDYAVAFDSKRENIRLRYQSIDYAVSLFKSQPLFGVGVGLRKQYDATNVVLLTLAETGAVGLVAFLLLHAAILRMCWWTYRRLPKRDELGSPVILGVAFLLARFTHGLVDHYWGRGTNTLTWMAVGMALGVWSAVRAGQTAAPTSQWQAPPRHHFTVSSPEADSSLEPAGEMA